MRTLATIVIGLTITGLALADDKQKIDKDKLIGVWKVIKSEGAPPGATAEFTKDGKIILLAELEGKKIKFEGTYKVEGDKLHTEMKLGDKEDKDTDTIKVLTAEKLTLVDKDGKESTFEKVKK